MEDVFNLYINFKIRFTKRGWDNEIRLALFTGRIKSTKMQSLGDELSVISIVKMGIIDLIEHRTKKINQRCQKLHRCKKDFRSLVFCDGYFLFCI